MEGKGFRPGVVAVIQTFGDRANFHPHVHTLLTRGGWTEAGDWVPVPYVLALAKKCGFPAGEGLELGGEVFGVAGLGRLFEDLVDDGKEVVEGAHGGQRRS